VNQNCRHLKCSLGRPYVHCTATCFMARAVRNGVDVPSTDPRDKQIVELKARIVLLEAGPFVSTGPIVAIKKPVEPILHANEDFNKHAAAMVDEAVKDAVKKVVEKEPKRKYTKKKK